MRHDSVGFGGTSTLFHDGVGVVVATAEYLFHDENNSSTFWCCESLVFDVAYAIDAQFSIEDHLYRRSTK